MKIRNGFVSNSSTSSFCIYGASLEFDNEALKRFLLSGKNNDPDGYDKAILKELCYQESDDFWAKECRKVLTLIREIDENTDANAVGELKEIDDWSEMLGGICPLFYRYDYNSETGYLGKSWPSIGDDEIVGKWKAKITTEIQKWVPDAECETIAGEYAC